MKNQPKKRTCALPGCRTRFVPDFPHHYFSSQLCFQEARLLYGAGSQLRGPETNRLAADLAAGRWRPVYVRRGGVLHSA